VAVTLVVADDHPIVLEGLVQLFRLEPDFDVLARCTNGDETLEAVRRHEPDVVVLDVRMPGKDGLAVLREIAQEVPRTRVVLLTAGLDEEGVVEAVRLGAWGLVLKEMAPQTLVECVQKVRAGERWLDSPSVVRALEKITKKEADVARLSALVTPRELEIIRMIATGLRNKEIAARLSISEGTVKLHLHNIYEKLRLDGRMALLLYAQEHGLA
jgi:DNA-binding NarL/FixJ family response regulator